VLGDPGQRVSEAALVVADAQRGDAHAGGRGHFQGVCVAMRVAADDGVDNICQHGHTASGLLPGMGPWSVPAWVESPCGISVTGHAPRGADRLLIKPTGGPGRCRRRRGQVRRMARSRGQIRSESPGITGSEPGGSPPRTAGMTLNGDDLGRLPPNLGGSGCYWSCLYLAHVGHTSRPFLSTSPARPLRCPDSAPT
jgi:hypothetical protein